jgi:hypothetical protein
VGSERGGKRLSVGERGGKRLSVGAWRTRRAESAKWLRNRRDSNLQSRPFRAFASGDLPLDGSQHGAVAGSLHGAVAMPLAVPGTEHRRAPPVIRRILSVGHFWTGGWLRHSYAHTHANDGTQRCSPLWRRPQLSHRGGGGHSGVREPG